jgi:polysaccharide export outer membrane protein
MRIHSKALLLGLTLLMSACGAAYISPAVRDTLAAGAEVTVVPLTAAVARAANASDYRPADLPPAFYNVAGATPAQTGAGALPTPPSAPETRPAALITRLPPAVAAQPYTIGVGDVLVLATPQEGSTVEALSGLLAAQNRRQGYTVQDDGAIAIPDVGRIAVQGLTLDGAEDAVFEALVANQIDPAFSLEVAEFNSRRISIGGAVKDPGVVHIGLTPLHLDEALAQAGGVTAPDPDSTRVRLYRDGALYQVPLTALFSATGLQKIPLVAGDSVFVDTAFDLAQAQAYFEEQIRLVQTRGQARSQALSQLQTEFNIRRAALADQRGAFQTRLELGAEPRAYVYLAGEVSRQARLPLPFGRQASLADILYEGGGFSVETGNPSRVYVLRGSEDLSTVTAYQLNARNAAALLVATRFEMRPNDIIFVAEQPITRWNRVLRQFIPSLITTAAASTNN